MAKWLWPIGFLILVFGGSAWRNWHDGPCVKNCGSSYDDYDDDERYSSARPD